MVVVVVYRAPWTSVADNKNLRNQLDLVVVNYCKIIIAGDFNKPNARFDLPLRSETDHLRCLVEKHDLHLLKPATTRGFSHLVIIFVVVHVAKL